MAKEAENSSHIGTKEGEKRHTIIAPIVVINKVKYIAWFERMKYEKTAFITAMEDYVGKWEKKNGEITPAMIKKMEDSK